MILNSTEELVYEPIEIDGITYKFEDVSKIKDIDKSALKYVSSVEIKDISNCDYVVAYKDDKICAYFVAESVITKSVKAYMPAGETICSLKMVYYEDLDALKGLVFYMEKVTRARGISIVELDSDNSKYSEFYSSLIKELKYYELDNFIFRYVGFTLEERKVDHLEIRHAYPGEEYDIGKESKWFEEGETNLGYLESEDLKYTYAFDYIVGYDNSAKDYFGYLIGDTIRVTDSKTYNCYFVYDFYIYADDDGKYQSANILFDYIIDLCKFRTVEYIRVKIVDNKFYNPFYDYCKNYLNMYEEDGYLVKKI